VSIATTTDLVNRDFTATAANQLWVTDITEHPTREARVYTCVVLDAYSRKAVGWAISRRADTTLVNSAIDMAARSRTITPATIIHTDHGPQGGFNWSSQHLEVMEVFDGGEVGLEQEDQRCSRGRAAAVACGSGVAPGDAFAGFTDAVAGGAATVLAVDRHGYHLCGSGVERGRVRAGGNSLVSPRWWHATTVIG
jgi:hypothetical protein